MRRNRKGRPHGARTGIILLVWISALYGHPVGASASGTIDTVAGGRLGDGFQARLAAHWFPKDLEVDPQRHQLYIADANAHRVRRVDLATGIITTVAGTGGNGAFGDGGSATQAALSNPSTLAVDRQGNLFIGDVGSATIRRVDAATNVIETIAGKGFCDDSSARYEGLALLTDACGVWGLVAGDDGSIYYTHVSARVVRKLYQVGAEWYVTTVAGNGQSPGPGNISCGGAALDAEFGGPFAIAKDADGNLYVTDRPSGSICRINTSGSAWTTDLVFTPSRVWPIGFWANGLAVNVRGGVGEIFVSDVEKHRVYRVELPAGRAVPYAGNGAHRSPSCGSGGPALAGGLTTPWGVALGPDGELYIANHGNYSVCVVRPSGTMDTFSGGRLGPYPGDGRKATEAGLYGPRGVAFAPDGSMYIADTENNLIRKVSPGSDGVIGPDDRITTIAGITSHGVGAGYGGPIAAGDTPATNYPLIRLPWGVTVDREGNVYIANTSLNRVEKVDPSGGITTIAGTGLEGYSGDGGPAILAQLLSPTKLAYDDEHHFLYICDLDNNRIRRVDTDGIITTVAGNGVYGYSGDGGDPHAANLNSPQDIALDSSGALYIADRDNNVIRRVADGVITTVVGSGTQGFAGDGGVPLDAELNTPIGLAVDGAGDLYIADFYNYRVRKVTWSQNRIQTIAGDGAENYYGDGGPAVQAALGWASGLAVDRFGNVYIADAFDAGRIRRVTV